MIRLTSEEIWAIICADKTGSTKSIGKEHAKAQLEKVVAWGNEECTEHHATYTPKHQCVQCTSSKWQALLGEIK